MSRKQGLSFLRDIASSFVHMANDLLQELGKRIKRVRVRHGWTQVVFAEKAGLARTFIADVEGGKRNISIMNLKLIADTLRISLSKLLSQI